MKCPITGKECLIRIPRLCNLPYASEDNFDKCGRIKELELFFKAGLYDQRDRLYRDPKMHRILGLRETNDR